jgi:CHAT domain-containing protein
LCLTNLGNSLSSRFTLSHRLEDLQEALDTYRQAVAASKPGSPGLAILLNNLAMGLYDCYTRIGRLEDLQEAESIFQQAAELGLSSAQETGLTAARTWGNWAMERHSWEQAVQAYQIVLRITENLYRTQLLSSNLEVWLRETQGLATHAAYALAKTGHLKRAIEIIEASRARFLREALERSRKDLVGLVDKGHNSLYERYKAMSARWETLRRQGQPDATQIGSEINIMGFDLRSELETAQKQIQGLVDEIRAVPGYQDFLQSLSAKQIMATAADQCLVYLFTTAIGGLALLVQSEQITPIWLDRLTETALREQVLGSQDQTKLGGYLGAYSIWRSAAANGNISESEKQTASDLWWAALDHTTHWLWDNCLNQVTQILAGQNIQHAVLIPSGLLGLLPLHAAWKEDPVCKTGRYYALDTLQFSYAPSAHSLRAAQERKDRPADAILAVDNPDGSIEFAREATEVAIAHFDPQQVIRLEKNQAAPEQVKTELQQAAVLQFYTHGTASFTEPLDHSFLLLASGLHLTLREILDLKLDRARLAFLAACETGIPGTQIIDEVVSLPAGMMQAGVPGIIGSLWIVSDISTMLLVARFYNLWKSKDSQLSPAEALRQAQIWLRDTTNQEKRDYLHSTALIPGAAARSASDHLLLEFPQHERSFAHPYYWAAFGYTGL